MNHTKILITAFVPLTYSVRAKTSVSVLVDSQDEFTDERELTISIIGGGQDENPTTAAYNKLKHSMLTFLCVMSKNTPQYGVAITPSGITVHLENTIPVKYRFDKEKAKDANFIWIKNQAVILSAETFLDETLTSDVFLAKVGDSKSTWFDLATARTDVEEFKKRCITDRR